MNTTVAINAYNDVSIETSVNGADPHKLIAMLFQAALLAIAKARHEMLRKQIAAKGKSISRAIAIIGEGLNASLDRSVGGELAQNLSALYDYMVGRLVAANLKNDVAALDEVAHLLTELKGAWDSIRPQVMQSGAQPHTGANGRPTHARA
jgi:flagellar protein FliS